MSHVDTVIETNLEELKAAFDAFHRQMLNINNSVENIKNIAIILNASSIDWAKILNYRNGEMAQQNLKILHMHMYPHTATPTCFMGIQVHKHAQTQIMSL